jgi:membrane-bound lytic murein transglycosylase B
MRLAGVSPEVQLHVASVIESAANYIAENGWHQGDFFRAGATACAATALLIAAGQIRRPSDVESVESMDAWNELENDLAVVAFADYVRSSGGLAYTQNTVSIWAWNDAEGRTEDEVLTALMSCAESLRSGARVAA